MKIYHLTDCKNITQFNLDYLDGGEHVNGPGVYFTSNHENLDYDFYFNGDPEGTIYEVEIDVNNYFKSDDKINKEIIDSMIDLSIDKDILNQYKDELYNRYLNQNILLFLQEFPFKSYYFEKNFGIINNDFKEDLKTFCLNFCKASNKDGMIMKFNEKRTDILVMNPYSLTIEHSFQPLKEINDLSL